MDDMKKNNRSNWAKHMNSNAKLHRAAVAALLAAMFAGSGLTTAATAIHAGALAPIWLMAALSSGACALIASSPAGVAAGATLLAIAGGGWILTHLPALRAMPLVFAALRGAQPSAEALAAGSQALMVCAALVFGMLFFVLLYRRGGTSVALTLLIALLVFSHGMSPDASVAAAVPGLIAGAAAFALSEGVQRDRPAFRILAPAALAVAAAFLLIPAGRVTWAPMERLATQVRSVFEQYFNFTHERIAFSIAEEGYNHGGEVDGQAVAMLGGPANPDPGAVMRVEADGPILLRGAIRGTYTGYSWVDTVPKSRYLYYDITHRTVRDRVFDLDFDSPEEAFRPVSAKVELIDSGTSTLFVPGRMSRFEMDMSNAVYYNSAGEMFMAREAQPGDRYEADALMPVFGDDLMQAVLWGETGDDDQYAGILAAHSALPEGIDARLYGLTMEITSEAQNAYDCATAIADYLRGSMRYRLDAEYPPRGRDFVSYFVLDYKQGYCSYFASAMAVMGRIAGLPTRYVEGYYARPGEDGTVTLTGMDAHAWAEIYFEGVGWVPFDATAGSAGGPGPADDPQNSEYGYGGAQQPDTSIAPLDDPDRSADGIADGDAQSNLDGEPTPTPSANPFDAPEDEPEDAPEEDESDFPPENGDADPPGRGAGRGAWVLAAGLLLIVIAVLLALWVRRRLQASDPERLCADAKRSAQAAMIAYRANLTLLAHLGQFPQSGESPDAFAQRVSAELNNPDFTAFASAVTLGRYGGRPIRRADVTQGLRAYRGFLGAMRRTERARFLLTRIFRGLGDFEQIP